MSFFATILEGIGSAFGGGEAASYASSPPSNPFFSAGAGTSYTPSYDLFSSGGVTPTSSIDMGGAGGLSLGGSSGGLTMPSSGVNGFLPEGGGNLGMQPPSGGGGFNLFEGSPAMGSESMLSPNVQNGSFSTSNMPPATRGAAPSAMDQIKAMFQQAGARAGGPAGGIVNGALRYGPAIMQMIAGLRAQEESKRLRKQVDGTQMAMPNPAEITSMPGYQAGIEAVMRSMAAQGYQGSGNMAAALQKYGGDAYNQYFTQQLNRNNHNLGVAQAGAGPAYGGISGLALLSQGIRDFAGGGAK